jgi:hypothetical protein
MFRAIFRGKKDEKLKGRQGMKSGLNRRAERLKGDLPSGPKKRRGYSPDQDGLSESKEGRKHQTNKKVRKVLINQAEFA